MAKYVDGADQAEVEKATERALKAAFEQMRECGYGNRYRASGQRVHLIAAVCGHDERNLLKVQVEPAQLDC